MTEEIEEAEETAVVTDEEQPVNSEEVVEPTEEETEVDKWKKTAENYKRELDGYRKPNIDRLQKEIQKPLDSSVSKAVENDYLSKSADVIDELEGEFQSLEPAKFKRIEPLIVPAMRAAFDEAAKKGSYVARGKLKSVVAELISFARGPKVEKTSTEIATEQEQLESAEISAVRPPKNKIGVAKATERDAALAEESGVAVSVITANRLAREKREADFAKTIKHV